MTRIIDNDYIEFLSELKDKIKNSQLKAAVAVNQELVKLYWHIGKQIIEKQRHTQWGEGFLKTLSKDLQNTFPETRGFSLPNLKRMRLFASTYPQLSIGSQPVTQLPWGHIVTLLFKIKDPIKKDWYISKIIEEGWSRSTLLRSIEISLYERQAIPENKTSNFTKTLPSHSSGLAQDILKNPYNLDFLELHDHAIEKEIERASMKHIQKFLLELGKGFAFVGRQVPISLQGEEYFIDLLFYHLKLHCYVVIELKATKFKPEHTGQINFYLNLVDDFYKTPEDAPSIGLLLCKTSDQFVAEYALRGITNPIGISEYQLTQAIPTDLKTNLPSIEELEAKLNELPEK